LERASSVIFFNWHHVDTCPIEETVSSDAKMNVTVSNYDTPEDEIEVWNGQPARL